MKKAAFILFMFVIEAATACRWAPFDGTLEEAAKEVLKSDIVAQVKILKKSEKRVKSSLLKVYEVDVLNSYKGPKDFSKFYSLNHSCGFFQSVGKTALISGNTRESMGNKLIVDEMRPFPFEKQKLIQKIKELTQKE